MIRSALAFLILFSGAALACGDHIVIKQPNVYDADTFREGDTDLRIRLWGVDAPERDQPYGETAAAELATFLNASLPLTCEKMGTSFDRIVAICKREDGADVNEFLVENGLVWDAPKFSKGRYSKAMETARSAGIGLWGLDDPIEPEQWRKDN